MKKIKAVNVDTKEERKVYEAFDFTKEVKSNATYHMELFGTLKEHSLILYPVSYKVEDIESGFHGYHWFVNGVLHDSLYTNSIKFLKESHEEGLNNKEIKIKYDQLTLF